ncbi:hypothetical protein A3709_19285 [Halioglobus sp. HI00S01]|uniref:hypothetical protein n=1 Tax=Halioglobus sp. HI00S01 TaxID=1822214 RepID=UPI0007C313B1|nr:hypothetical protein [Halioglobus sp. HI00S01]KZX57768.1 hypothetical protein A3709_19285 [Halioglobus sp. HI00S01]
MNISLANQSYIFVNHDSGEMYVVAGCLEKGSTVLDHYTSHRSVIDDLARTHHINDTGDWPDDVFMSIEEEGQRCPPHLRTGHIVVIENPVLRCWHEKGWAANDAVYYVSGTLRAFHPIFWGEIVAEKGLHQEVISLAAS